MSLFIPALTPALDSNGKTISGATWSFFRSGTSEPLSVYADSDLTTELGSVVTANSAGKFVPIYLDDDETYRVKLEDDDGEVLDDVDPYSTFSSEHEVTFEMFGAVGDGEADDTAALLAAAATGRPVRVTRGDYGVTSMVTFTAGIQGDGSTVSTIKALAEMPVMVTFDGGATGYVPAHHRISDIAFDGNNLATDCVQPIAMKGSTFERVRIRGAKRDGLRPLAATDNNNAIAFRNCVFTENGSIINAGTSFTAGAALSSSAARCSASGTSVTVSGADPATFGIELGKDLIRIPGHKPSVITAIAGQVLTVDPALPTIPANTAFAIFKGAGMYVARGSDNNVWATESCIFFVNAAAGIIDHALYGVQEASPAYEGNGCYGKITGVDAGAFTFCSQSSGAYYENNGAGKEWVKAGNYYSIDDPVPGTPDEIRKTAGIVSFEGAVAAEASVTVDAPVNWVMMEETLDGTYYIKTLVVTQGLAGSDISVIVPTEPVNPDLPETFTIHMADISFKTLVVKTEDDDTKINGVNGTTGYPFAGSNRTLTFRWDAKTNGWSVAASGQDESAATPSTGTWAIGRRVYNSAPTAGGTIGWVMTSGGWKTFGAIAA